MSLKVASIRRRSADEQDDLACAEKEDWSRLSALRARTAGAQKTEAATTMGARDHKRVVTKVLETRPAAKPEPLQPVPVGAGNGHGRDFRKDEFEEF